MSAAQRILSHLNYEGYAIPMRYRSIARKLRVLRWATSVALKNGWPNILLTFSGGLGDHLLCTSVLHELKRRGRKRLWMMSDFEELFIDNNDVDTVVPEEDRYKVLVKRLGGKVVDLYYAPNLAEEDRDEPPNRHIISCMCQEVGVSDSISLQPYLTLSTREKELGRIARKQITIQSSGLGARYPMLSKEWYPERFQEIVDALNSNYSIIQIGSASDPPLRNVIDLRGKTSIRHTAGILSQSLVFVGLVGGLMHLSRAVDCRAVIVYGGRELPSQSGYSCNENLVCPLSCSPCWRWNSCKHDRECMKRIDVESVLEAVIRQVKLFGNPLKVDVDNVQLPNYHASSISVELMHLYAHLQQTRIVKRDLSI